MATYKKKSMLNNLKDLNKNPTTHVYKLQKALYGLK